MRFTLHLSCCLYLAFFDKWLTPVLLVHIVVIGFRPLIQFCLFIISMSSFVVIFIVAVAVYVALTISTVHFYIRQLFVLFIFFRCRVKGNSCMTSDLCQYRSGVH